MYVLSIRTNAYFIIVATIVVIIIICNAAVYWLKRCGSDYFAYKMFNDRKFLIKGMVFESDQYTNDLYKQSEHIMINLIKLLLTINMKWPLFRCSSPRRIYNV